MTFTAYFPFPFCWLSRAGLGNFRQLLGSLQEAQHPVGNEARAREAWRAEQARCRRVCSSAFFQQMILPSYPCALKPVAPVKHFHPDKQREAHLQDQRSFCWEM